MTKGWFVAHTRPRCEKKVKTWCEREGMEAVLPCSRSVKRYPGKTLTFLKPLFPNYIFLRLLPEERRRAVANRHVAAILEVVDQELFQQQLNGIIAALDQELEVRLAPQIAEGKQVRITSGALRGVEGIVEKRAGVTWVYIRLEFMSEGAAIRIEASELELI